jgi:hypothetical protein
MPTPAPKPPPLAAEASWRRRLGLLGLDTAGAAGAGAGADALDEDVEDAEDAAAPPGGRRVTAAPSVASSGDGAAALAMPQPDEPLRRFVSRLRECEREEFEALLRLPEGIYNVSPDDLAASARPLHARRPEHAIDVPDDGARARRPRRARARAQRPTVERSFLGVPTFRPDHPAYRYWCLLVLALDLTYSAFVVPVSIGGCLCLDVGVFVFVYFSSESLSNLAPRPRVLNSEKKLAP